MNILKSDFFDRNAVLVAKDLIGKHLMREIDGKTIELVINETEAYTGPFDLACHAKVGKTKRNAALFGHPGTVYVYFIYGMHWMLNFVTGPCDFPSGVLIRGAGKFNGPAKLTKYLKIDKNFNFMSQGLKVGLWIEDKGIKIEDSKIVATPRIGVDYAGPIWATKPYRFVLKNH